MFEQISLVVRSLRPKVTDFRSAIGRELLDGLLKEGADHANVSKILVGNVDGAHRQAVVTDRMWLAKS